MGLVASGLERVRETPCKANHRTVRSAIREFGPMGKEEMSLTPEEEWFPEDHW